MWWRSGYGGLKTCLYSARISGDVGFCTVAGACVIRWTVKTRTTISNVEMRHALKVSPQCWAGLLRSHIPDIPLTRLQSKLKVWLPDQELYDLIESNRIGLKSEESTTETPATGLKYVSCVCGSNITLIFCVELSALIFYGVWWCRWWPDPMDQGLF